MASSNQAERVHYSLIYEHPGVHYVKDNVGQSVLLYRIHEGRRGKELCNVKAE